MAPTSRDVRPIIALSASAVFLATAYIIRRNQKSTSSKDEVNDDAAGKIAVAAIDAVNARRGREGEPVMSIMQSESDGMIHKEIDILPSQDSIENKVDADHPQCERVLSQGTITIAYCSTTGTCAGFANRLHGELSNRTSLKSYRKVQLIKVSDVDWWDELVNNEDEEDNHDNNGTRARLGPPVLLFVLPTWTNGALPPDSDTLLQSLREISTDWRVAPEPLRTVDPHCQLKVGAFGMGSSAYDASTVGKPAKDVFATLVGKLGARPLVIARKGSAAARDNSGGKKSKSLMIGDSEVGDPDIIFERWMNGIIYSVISNMDGLCSRNAVVSNVGKEGIRSEVKTAVENEHKCDDDGNRESKCACKSSENGHGSNSNETPAGCCSTFKKSTDEDVVSLTDSLSDDDEEDEDNSDSGDDDDVLDVEDMGEVIRKQYSALKANKEPQEMVTPKQAKALKKEGYKLIGTHSAVKLCRWTKHQLRGRGGCYKHTHYGITSYQCMEATPSLACANKCVFCWRHHKNPVGREWRWKMDDPKMIVEEAVKEHISMIKETRGIPGIQMDRWTEAHTVRHCALSLVGEPIMYPKINELLHELHDRKISTFLVTNGQHPQAINDLIPITQLVRLLLHNFLTVTLVTDSNNTSMAQFAHGR